MMMIVRGTPNSHKRIGNIACSLRFIGKNTFIDITADVIAAELADLRL
jgi:hypothetical protein